MMLGTGVDIAITISRFLLAYVTIYLTNIGPDKFGRNFDFPKEKTGTGLTPSPYPGVP
jgi:hypothetical protein